MGELCWTPNLDHGNDITDYPVVHFCFEFLAFPTVGWVVEWRGRVGAKDTKVKHVAKDTKVKHVGTGRIWVLTGEYNLERNTYAAAWPD